MRQKLNWIPGSMMRPVSMTNEENEEVFQSTAVSIKEGFYDRYRSLKGEMEIVAECAKIYIYNNWEKVKDWSNLEIIMEDANTDVMDKADKTDEPEPYEYVEYFNYTGEKLKRSEGKSNAKWWNEMLKKRDEDDKARHNPVMSVTDVVLDPSDGDFSLTVNGRVHMWISDATVIILSKFVEEQLKKQEDDNQGA